MHPLQKKKMTIPRCTIRPDFFAETLRLVGIVRVLGEGVSEGERDVKGRPQQGEREKRQNKRKRREMK
jgi:hypothetical protein